MLSAEGRSEIHEDVWNCSGLSILDDSEPLAGGQILNQGFLTTRPMNFEFGSRIGSLADELQPAVAG